MNFTTVKYLFLIPMEREVEVAMLNLEEVHYFLHGPDQEIRLLYTTNGEERMFSLLKVIQIQNLFYLKKIMDLVQFGLVFVSNNYKSNDNVLMSTKIRVNML